MTAMTVFSLRLADPARDFNWIASLINSVDVEPTSETELNDWYQRKLPNDIHF
jgi:hypothetical protein